MKKWIICDLDGTLFTAGKDEGWYDRDFTKDIVIPEVRELLNRYGNYCIIFITARSEKYQEQTILRLWHEGFDVLNNSGLKLFMRQNNDKREDHLIKKQIYRKYLKDVYDIAFVIEDRPSVVRMWRNLGLFVFEVNQLNKEF